MKSTLNSLALIITLNGFSLNTHAHSGIEHSSNMHMLLHAILGITVCLALMAVGFYLRKHLPAVIRQRK